METKEPEEAKEAKEGICQEDITAALNAIYAEEESGVDKVVWRLQYASLVESPDSMLRYRRLVIIILARFVEKLLSGSVPFLIY